MEREALPGNPVQNLVVAKYRDGRMIKGVTYNFGPEKKVFHVVPLEKESNNLRVFIVFNAAREIDILK